LSNLGSYDVRVVTPTYSYTGRQGRVKLLSAAVKRFTAALH